MHTQIKNIELEWSVYNPLIKTVIWVNLQIGFDAIVSVFGYWLWSNAYQNTVNINLFLSNTDRHKWWSVIYCVQCTYINYRARSSLTQWTDKNKRSLALLTIVVFVTITIPTTLNENKLILSLSVQIEV